MEGWRNTNQTHKTGELKFVERFNKAFTLAGASRRWCISADEVQGHRIPAYYCDEDSGGLLWQEMPEATCPAVAAHTLHRMRYTGYMVQFLLWPFSCGWPADKTEDLD